MNQLLNSFAPLLAQSFFSTRDVHDFVMTFVYSFVGLAVFGLFFFIVVRMAPFSVVKEIEKDQNVALAVLMGSVMLGLAIIIASAIHG